MRKFDVVIALEKVAEMRSTWSASKRVFDESVNQIMTRLLHEAAQSYMSPEEVASASGLKVAQVRSMMRLNGLDPKKGKTLLAKTAAEALANNADLLGISVHDMDLMSPLAYLPMGDQMKRDLTEAGVHTVTEFPETDAAIDALTRLADQAVHTAGSTDGIAKARADFDLVLSALGGSAL